MCSGLDADGAQQEGWQISGAVVDISGDLGDRFGRAAGPRVIEARNRGRNALAPRRAATPSPATAAVLTVAPLTVGVLVSVLTLPVRAPVRLATVVLGRLGVLGRGAARFAGHPGNALCLLYTSDAADE